MIRRISVLLCLFSLLSHAAMAQTSLGASRINGTSTAARFTLGLSKDNGATYVTSATTSDTIRIIGTITPEAAQLNQQADIFVVAKLGTSYYMRNAAGNFVPWSFAIPELTAFRTKQTLSNNFQVDFITGNIPVTGTLQLFLGYKATDGVLIYTPVPAQITITTPVVVTGPTVREQATSAFAATVSPRVVQSICIACHIKGGEADRVSSLIFVTPSNSNHLSLNFTQFENLKAAGRSYILNKTLGIGHDGGQQLLSNSQDYKNLDAFLQLVEKL